MAISSEVPDTEKKRGVVEAFDVFLLLYNFVAYFGDMALDICVGLKMSLGYRITSFALILAQSVSSNVASWKWYQNSGQKIQPWEVAMHVLLLAPVSRCMKAFYYAWKARSYENNRKTHYEKLFLESIADIGFIALLEGFLEAGPQLIIQIGVLIINVLAGHSFKTDLMQLISITLSISNLGMTMVNYHSSLRRPQMDKGDISASGKIIMFFWHVMVGISRITVLVCLFVMSPVCMVACVLHIVGFYVYLQKYGPLRNFDLSEIWHQLLLLSLSFVFIFNGVPMRDGRTRTFYFVIYSTFFVEGASVLIVAYFMFPWRLLIIIWSIVSVLSFTLGLAFMGLYYYNFHPKHQYCNSVPMSDVT